MKWLTASLISQGALALYFQAIQWFPLGRWNAQPGFTPFGVQVVRGEATWLDALLLACFLLPFLVFWLAWARGLRGLMWACTLGYAVWLALQVKTWWGAYLFGASDSWLRTYERVFSRSTQLLPRWGRHLPPDGMHLVLQVLLAAAVGCAVVGLARTSDRRRDIVGAQDERR